MEETIILCHGAIEEEGERLRCGGAAAPGIMIIISTIHSDDHRPSTTTALVARWRTDDDERRITRAVDLLIYYLHEVADPLLRDTETYALWLDIHSEVSFYF